MAIEIAVDARSASGKKTKHLRAAGIVPGVVFGKKAGSIPVQLGAKEFEALYREAGRTNIIAVSVDGGPPTSVVIKSVQRDPLSGRTLHVDFFALDLAHQMTAEVPLVFIGEAPGVALTGGFLLTSVDRLRVRALPSEMPHELTVDLSGLIDLEAAIHVRDIGVSLSVTVLNDPDELVAKVNPPRIEVEEEPVLAEEELLEGEAGEGEAPAEGEAASADAADGAGAGRAEGSPES